MRVLVTGGAGYIGSVVVEKLLATSHEVSVLDNLSTGHRESVPSNVTFHDVDLLDADRVTSAISSARPEAIIHMAGAALVGESMTDPGKYFRINVTGSNNLLTAMVAAGTKRIIFSSTAAVYGEPESLPLTEESALDPTNPYGESKLMVERMLRWYSGAHGIRYGVLRYFNAAGATEQNGENHAIETHLIPLVLEVAAGSRDSLSIFGTDYDTPDGTCVRDYIHVSDLADAHLRLLPLLETLNATYNLGCGGNGYSVREVIEAAQRATGTTIAIREAPRRPGDPAVLIASNDRIRHELDWTPQHQNIDEIVSSAWAWMQRSRG